MNSPPSLPRIGFALTILALIGIFVTSAILLSGFDEVTYEEDRFVRVERALEDDGGEDYDGDVDNNYSQGTDQLSGDDRTEEVNVNKSPLGYPEDQFDYVRKTDNVTRTEFDLPDYFPFIAVATVLLALVALILSGKVAMDTKGHQNLVRNDLLDFITVNPGINLSSIRRELELSQGAVSYHLNKLEKSGEILTDKGMKERRYYPSSMGYSNAMDKSSTDEAEAIMSSESSRKIVDLLREEGMRQSDIVDKTGLSPSTVHWHMERLHKAGIVSKKRVGRSVKYTLEEEFHNT